MHKEAKKNKQKIISQFISAVIICLLIAINSFSQTRTIDSLRESMNQTKDNILKISICNSIVRKFYDLRNFDSLKHYGYKSLELSKEAGNSDNLFEPNYFLGNMFNSKGVYDSAAIYYYKALDITEKNNNLSQKLECIYALGENARSIGTYTRALDLLKQAQQINSSSPDSLMECRILNRFAAVYYEMRDYKTANDFCEKSLSLSEKLDKEDLTASTYNILGMVYYHLGKLEPAISTLNKANELFKKVNPADAPNVLNNLGGIFYETGDYQTAIKYFTESYNYAIESKILVYSQIAAMFLSEIYEKTGDYKNALKYAKINDEQKSILYSNKISSEVKNYQFNYEKEKADKELNTVKANEETNRKLLILSLIAVFVSVLFLIIVTMFLRKSKKAYLILREQKEELKKLSDELRTINTTKDKFFSIIAHDLRNPFNAIIGFSTLLHQDFDSFNDEDKKDMLKSIVESSNTAYQLLENLLHWSYSQSGRMQIKNEMTNLYLCAENSVQLSAESAKKKNINIQNHIPKNENINSDHNLLSFVIRNLLSNAIKFTNPDGKIIISSERKKSFLRVCIEDNGVGIPASKISNLFSMDYSKRSTGTAGEQGSGLGLIVCKEFIEKIEGKIYVESEQNKGTKIYFTIPLN